MSSWIPPLNFAFIDERLVRCTGPITRSNALYCASIKVERILNFSGVSFDPQVIQLFDEQGIRIQEVNFEKEDVSPSNVVKFQEWIALCVEDVISQFSHAFTLIVGNSETFLDCLIVACLRKVQEWAIVPIISEFRTFTFPFKLLDLEQAIEFFDEKLVDIDTLAPEWYTMHSNIKVEEIKLKQSHPKRMKLIESGEDKYLNEEEQEQLKIDLLLHKLFLNETTQWVSPEVIFDPQRSLVADKDEDD